MVDNPKSHKNTRIAEEELAKGLLEYDAELPEDPEAAEEKRRKG